MIGVLIIDDDESAGRELESLLTREGAPDMAVRAVLTSAEVPGALAAVDAGLALIGRIDGPAGRHEMLLSAALARPEPLTLAGYGGFGSCASAAGYTRYLNGILPASLTGPELVHVVRLLASGLKVWATMPDRAVRLGYLTPRERDVLTLLSDGLSNDQIAGRLALHVGTVKDHISSVYMKCGVTNRVEATLFAHGLNVPSSGARRVGVAAARPQYA
ncbi:LuxR C-terminal-related transcriptional regulator [Streptomyces sp. NPDC021093]|uniref:helix-turn-helix transcriptional regulator n=1 Tax=Streptomyces sp. NPDC021093 TaxID=3365112 RepID=UPI0037BC4F44